MVRPARADSLQGQILAGRSVQAEAAAAKAEGTAPARGGAATAALVLGDGFGIGGVRVTLVDPGDPKAVFASTSDADGRFSVDGLPAGTYRVTLDHRVLGRRTMQAMAGKGAGELVFVWESVPGRPPGDLPMPSARP